MSIELLSQVKEKKKQRDKQVYFLLFIGGASVNIDFLQIVADIFNKPAYAALAPNSACFGSALRAFDISNSKNSTIK